MGTPDHGWGREDHDLHIPGAFTDEVAEVVSSAVPVGVQAVGDSVKSVFDEDAHPYETGHFSFGD